MTDQTHRAGKRDLPAPGRPQTHRETAEVADGVGRQVAAIGRRLAAEDPSDLDILMRLQARMDQAWLTAVTGIRIAGFTDAEIGAVLGITRQAVQQRWPREQQDVNATDEEPQP